MTRKLLASPLSTAPHMFLSYIKKDGKFWATGKLMNSKRCETWEHSIYTYKEKPWKFMLWPSLCRDRLFEQVVSYLNLNYVLHFTPFIKFLSPWKGWCNISNKVLFRDNLFIWVHWNLICLDPVPLIFVCLHSLSSWSQ